jgi:hypothetical protein
MRGLAAALALLLFAAPALADAPPSHYDLTPLTKADIEFYLSVLRPAAAYVQSPNADDRAAIAYMRQNHGSPKLPDPPQVPAFNGAPTAAQMAALQAAMADYQKKIALPNKYMTRAAQLASYDNEIARQRHVEKQYDDVRSPIESAIAAYTGAVGSCGGDCGEAHPTAAQVALWKKFDMVAKANVAFIKPWAAEITRLRKVLQDVMLGH